MYMYKNKTTSVWTRLGVGLTTKLKPAIMGLMYWVLRAMSSMLWTRTSIFGMYPIDREFIPIDISRSPSR